MGMVKKTELLVKTKNEKGALAKVLNCLAEAGVNLLGFLCPPAGKTGTIHLLPEDVARAAAALRKAGYKVDRAKVSFITAEDKPGSGAKAISEISAKKMNIEYAYATSGKGAEFGMVVKTGR